MPYPQKIETVHIETLEGELCIYNWQRMEVHNLNATAATVWQLCDGRTPRSKWPNTSRAT